MSFSDSSVKVLDSYVWISEYKVVIEYEERSVNTIFLLESCLGDSERPKVVNFGKILSSFFD